MELARVIPRTDGVHHLQTISQWTPDKGLTKMKAEDFPDLGSFELTVVTIDVRLLIIANRMTNVGNMLRTE